MFFSHCTSSDVILCFLKLSRKLWIVQVRFLGIFYVLLLKNLAMQSKNAVYGTPCIIFYLIKQWNFVILFWMRLEYFHNIHHDFFFCFKYLFAHCIYLTLILCIFKYNVLYIMCIFCKLCLCCLILCTVLDTLKNILSF